jgi:hypothetical protein
MPINQPAKAIPKPDETYPCARCKKDHVVIPHAGAPSTAYANAML